MTVFNDAPTFAGSGGVAAAMTERAAVGVVIGGGGAMIAIAVERLKDGAVLAGKGLLDSWRVSNVYDYDPSSGVSKNMRLRRARLSTEGVLGDD